LRATQGTVEFDHLNLFRQKALFSRRAQVIRDKDDVSARILPGLSKS
jgi:hypothetical protein